MKKVILSIVLLATITACTTTENMSSSYKNASIHINENGIRINTGLNYNISY